MCSLWTSGFVLLQNQLPYRLLEWLMSLSMKKEKLEDSINKFINGFVGVQNDHYSNWLSEKLWQGVLKQQQGQAISVDIREPKPIHLLEKPRTSLSLFVSRLFRIGDLKFTWWTTVFLIMIKSLCQYFFSLYT